MLGALRDGAKSGFLKFILLGFMALAVGGLVLTDVGGFFRGGISTNIVAKGKNIEIGTQQFDRSVRRILSRQGMAPQEAYRLGLINQILNSEIQVQILSREARKLGINVSDETVRAQISKLAEPLATDGVSKSDALKQVLRSQGVTEGEFVRSIRQEMGNTLFRNALLGGTTSISQQQAQDLYQFRNESRNFEGFILKNSAIKDIDPPTEENLQKFYEGNKAEFLISEKRSVTIATLKKEALESKIEVSDDELREIYASNIETYKKPEQRKLQQAILSTQTDAQDIFKKVEKGTSLKKAVKDITGKNVAYIGENDFERGGLLEEIADPAFEAEAGAILGPIQTALGWHVLVLKEVIEPQTESFEKAKKTLKDNVLQERLLEELVDAANTLDDQLAGGEELEVVVKEMGLTTETFSNFNQAGTNAKGKDLFANYQGDRAQILEAAFDFETGESSPVLELADGRFVTVRVDNVKELSYTPFKEVKSKLQTRWIDQQKTLSNKARAQDAMTKLETAASIKDVAKEYGVRVQTFSKIVRNAEPKAPLTLPALRQIFNSAKDQYLKLDINDGFVVGQVTAINLPDVDTADKEIEEITSDVSDAAAQEVLSQYINALSQKYKVEINDRVLQSVYGSPIEN